MSKTPFMLAAVVVAGAIHASPRANAAESNGPEQIQMTLPAGHFYLDASLETNLSKDAAFKPVSLAPDLWYGVTDDFTLGLVHSGRGATGVYGFAGHGVCFVGSKNGCPNAYNNVGIHGRYHLGNPGKWSIAAEGALMGNSLDPFQLALKAGALAHYAGESLSVDLAPSLSFGLTNRNEASGNKEWFILPATLLYPLKDRLGLAFQGALSLPLSDTAFTLFGVSAGVQYFATDKVILNGVFSLPALIGGSAVNDGIDLRTLTLGVAYAF